MIMVPLANWKSFLQLTRVYGVRQLFHEIRKSHGQNDDWKSDQLDRQFEERRLLLRLHRLSAHIHDG